MSEVIKRKRALDRIADALEKMTEPEEYAVAREEEENATPVCPYCRKEDPKVLLTESKAETVPLSALFGMELEAICLSCRRKIILRPIGFEVQGAEK